MFFRGIICLYLLWLFGWVVLYKGFLGMDVKEMLKFGGWILRLVFYGMIGEILLINI